MSWWWQESLQTGECICDKSLLLLQLDTTEKLTWPWSKKVFILQYGKPYKCGHGYIWLQLEVYMNLSVVLVSSLWPLRSQPTMDHISFWSFFPLEVPSKKSHSWLSVVWNPSMQQSLSWTLPLSTVFHLSCISGLLLLILQPLLCSPPIPHQSPHFAHFLMIFF